MQEYKIGQRIQNLRREGNDAGKYGIITDITYARVYVTYDDGNTGSSDEPERYYLLVGGCASGSCAINNEANIGKKIMLNVEEFVKNSLLSASEKAMREVGFKDSCGDFTQTAKDFAIISLCEDKEAKMIEVAKEMLAEAKKK